MSSLTEKIRLHKARTTQIVTRPYRDWLVQIGEQGYPPELAEWVGEQLKRQGRIRWGSFSASSGGTCLRKQELGFLGAETEDISIDPVLQNLFNDGKWRHLRWQIALMSSGLMAEAEVPLLWPRKRLIGSADGRLIVPNDHPNENWHGWDCGFELKGMNPYTYQNVARNIQELEQRGKDRNLAILPEHWAQISRYALVSGWELFSVVYENKSNQQWTEFVVQITQEMLDVAEKELDELNRAIDRRELHPMLPECASQQGQYKYCPYGQNRSGVCPSTKVWPDEGRIEKWQD